MGEFLSVRVGEKWYIVQKERTLLFLEAQLVSVSIEYIDSNCCNIISSNMIGTSMYFHVQKQLLLRKCMLNSFVALELCDFLYYAKYW